MRIVFVSNFFNHHQRFFSDAMYSLCDGEYAFIETDVIDEERKVLGWGEANLPNYVHYYHRSKDEKKLCDELIKKSDVIITGSASEKYLLPTHFSRKIVFRYSERPFKVINPKMTYVLKLYILEKIKNFSLSKTYLLCASAFTSSDYKKIGMYKNRTYKWGYFPEMKIYDENNLISEKDRKEILWCGRFLDWKHPDDAVSIAKKLVENGYDFRMKLIGTGPLGNKLNQMIVDYGLSKYIELCGSMTPQEVRSQMERAGIFLFTSDRYEGWGAVLNESMNSACAVVASDAAGSTPYLIENSVNGIVYKSGDLDDLYEAVERLLQDVERQINLGVNAYHTIMDEWNSENAAKKLFDLAGNIKNGQKYPSIYEKGVCSRT